MDRALPPRYCVLLTLDGLCLTTHDCLLLTCMCSVRADADCTSTLLCVIVSRRRDGMMGLAQRSYQCSHGSVSGKSITTEYQDDGVITTSIEFGDMCKFLAPSTIR